MAARSRTDTERNILESSLEHERARTLTRLDPSTSRPTRRTGGTVFVPGAFGASDLFTGHIDKLSQAERAAPGWCVRVGFPGSTDYRVDTRHLLAEVTLTTGGIATILEVDAGSAFQLHAACESISGRLRWGREPSGLADPLPELQWQLTRGWCATTATRTFELDALDSSQHANVPPFASRWTMYALHDPEYPETVLSASEASLVFSDGYEGTTVHEYDGDEVLALLGGSPIPVPPAARHWVWNADVDTRLRLTFFYGEVF